MFAPPCRLLPTAEEREHALRSLRRYLAAGDVAERIIKRHKVPRAQHQNCRKQADQIAFCLRQAFSYFDAADSVDQETKPVLLYYAASSLATAQVLWHGTGEHSLDRIRADHGAHGLEFGWQRTPPDETEAWLEALRAKPQLIRNEPYGLFALWSQFAEEDSALGVSSTSYGGGVGTSGPHAILGGDALEPVQSEGANLLQILQSMPAMINALTDVGLRSTLVRATLSQQAREKGNPRDWTIKMTVAVHPGARHLIDAVANAMRFHASEVNNIEVKEASSGFIFEWTERPLREGAKYRAYFPPGISTTIERHYFRTQLGWLNEFGLFYVGLFILGMLCRYYPDEWMRAVDARTHASLLIEHFCDISRRRLPLLTLGTLDGVVFACE